MAGTNGEILFCNVGAHGRVVINRNRAVKQMRRHLFRISIAKVVNIICHIVQRLRSPSRHLWRVVVERLVGSHFHRLFLASLSEIVPAWFVTFVFQWWKVHCARGCLYIS